MTAAIMSNPLDLAVYGNPRRKSSSAKRRRSRVKKKAKKAAKTKGNPMARRKTKKRSKRITRRKLRRNPAAMLKGYVSGITTAPKETLALFKGKKRVKNVASTAAGALATYVAGGMAAAQLSPMLARVPGVSTVLANPIGQRIVGASFPYTIGFVASRFLKGDMKKAVHLGGAIAALAEAINPGMVGRLAARVPGVSNLMAMAPVATPAPVEGLAGYFGNDMMLAAYEDAAAYAGATPGVVQGYEDAAAYAGATPGVQGYENAAAYAGATPGVEGYMDAPAYAGTGDDEALAGSYMDDSIFQSAI